jgi:hypothetical protein
MPYQSPAFLLDHSRGKGFLVATGDACSFNRRNRNIPNHYMKRLIMIPQLDWKKNAVFWDIKTEFGPHRKHNISGTEPSRLML